jgi:AcrR family transcriptional regulator
VRVRADAARNTSLVLEAAREVIAAKGLAAGVDEIAARAGVGKATVYRCWPTKELLVAAVAGARVDDFTERVLDALPDPDPTGALERLLLEAAEGCAANRLLYTGLTTETDELAEKRATCRAAMQRLVDRAIEQGGVRRDATSEDLTVLFHGVIASLTAAGESDPAVWRRYAALVLNALRA